MEEGKRKINWFLVLAGVVLVALGIVIFAAPWLFLEYLTVGAGAGFLISGFAGIGSYLKMRDVQEGTGLSLFMAILDIMVGIMLIVHPFVFVNSVPWMLGVAFIVFGVFEIAGTFPVARLIPESRTVMVISGILAVVVGAMFIIWPTSFSGWVAAFVLIRGITLLAIGVTAR